MTITLPADIHSHSEYSVDGEYTVKKMCASAQSCGLAVYAVTDHYDVSEYASDYADLDASLAKSLRDTLVEKDRYRGEIQILTGIELGQPLENRRKAEAVLRDHAFDFVLGAMHNPPGRPDFYYYDPDNAEYHLDTELENYFLALLSTVRWGLFDSAAHLTYPFRYILRHHEEYPFSKWDDHLEAIVKALSEKGLAMEINVSGIRKTPSHVMPEARWVRRFRELGGECLTFGADAHSPQYVGAGIPEAMGIAVEAGFSHVCYFVEREPRFIPLSAYML